MAPSANTTRELLPVPVNPLIRISFFFTKHPSMSQSQFESHWRGTHGRLAIATKAFHEAQIQQYSQIHNDKALTKKASELGLTPVEFEWDACSEMYVKSWEDYLVFATSDESRDILGPDGALIIHPDNGVRVMVTKVDPLFLRGRL